MPTGESRAPFGDRDTSKVPFRVTDDAYIPAERYTNPEFHKLEVERVWRHAWQVAAREDEMPKAGDYVEYVIGDDSILVVRQKDGGVKAFVNACRHRATQLGQGCGSFPTGQIVCPFHGWEYDLKGECNFVYSPQGFRPDTIEAEKVHLTPVQADTRWGLVWINMDVKAPGLEQYLGRVVDSVDPIWLDKMHVRWWKQVNLKANWKVAQEAFFEGYHIMQSHPELTLFGGRDDWNIDKMDALNPRTMFTDVGHWTNTTQVYNIPEGMKDLNIHSTASNIEVLIARNRAMWIGTQTTFSDRAYEINEEMIAEGIPADDNFPMILMDRILEDAKARNVPFPPPNPEATTWAHVFPNLTFLYGYGSVLMYRSRPDGNDPNACIYDFWALEVVPEGTPRTKPEQCSDEFFESMWLVHQDKGNIERQQVGLKSSGYIENRIAATTYEEAISFFHRYEDQILAKDPAEAAK